MRGETRAFLYGLGAGAAFWPVAYAAGQLAEQRERQDRDDGPVDAAVYCGSTFMELPCSLLDGHHGAHHAIRPGGDPLTWHNPCPAALVLDRPEKHTVPCKRNLGHAGGHESPAGHMWR